jgi:hypothetical protein
LACRYISAKREQVRSKPLDVKNSDILTYTS